VKIQNPSADFHCGYVAIVGWPNVGKSTLLNSLLGMKLSIVTPKPQTTRESVLGVLNEEGYQMIFLDTPGWLKPNEPFQKMMKKAIMRALYDDSDVVLWLVEPKPLTDKDKELAEALAKIEKPLFVVINKIDTPEGETQAQKTQDELSPIIKRETFPFLVSAKTKKGLTPLKTKLKSSLPQSPPYFPTDQVTDRWERYYVSEMIREQIFNLYHQEIPHASTVDVKEFKEVEGKKDHILCSVIVETNSQKKIMIGQKGRAIKNLSQSSRKRVEAWLGREIYLELNVEVRKNWRKDKEFIKNLHCHYS